MGLRSSVSPPTGRDCDVVFATSVWSAVMPGPMKMSEMRLEAPPPGNSPRSSSKVDVTWTGSGLVGTPLAPATTARYRTATESWTVENVPMNWTVPPSSVTADPVGVICVAPNV
jgi:hypothetical protein